MILTKYSLLLLIVYTFICKNLNWYVQLDITSFASLILKKKTIVLLLFGVSSLALRGFVVVLTALILIVGGLKVCTHTDWHKVHMTAHSYLLINSAVSNS